jgi:anti-anti-sigma factor
MTQADVRMTEAPGALVAQLTGEIDMSNAEDLGAAVIGATPPEASGVVLDLSGVDYMDSAGIFVIYSLRASLSARGQSLILVIPSRSPVRDALRLAGTARAGETVEAVEEALRALDPAASAS